jgi:hypothetical protein
MVIWDVDAYWQNLSRLFQDKHIEMLLATSNGAGQPADSCAYYDDFH